MIGKLADDPADIRWNLTSFQRRGSNWNAAIWYLGTRIWIFERLGKGFGNGTGIGQDLETMGIPAQEGS